MKIIAHRGASFLAPENTMTAFKRAWSEGADGIELDIRLTRDGELVVFHDENGKRVVGHPQTIKESSFEELRAWDIGSWKDPSFAAEKIVLLSDVLKSSPENSLTMIEIKDGMEMIDPLKKLLSGFPKKPVAILAFDAEVGAAAVENLKPFPVYLNVKARKIISLGSFIKKVQESKLHGLSLGWSRLMSRIIVSRIHEAGIPLAVWTMNNPADVIKAKEWGVDILMTDRPEIMVPLVGAK